MTPIKSVANHIVSKRFMLMICPITICKNWIFNFFHSWRKFAKIVVNFGHLNNASNIHLTRQFNAINQMKVTNLQKGNIPRIKLQKHDTEQFRDHAIEWTILFCCQNKLNNEHNHLIPIWHTHTLDLFVCFSFYFCHTNCSCKQTCFSNQCFFFTSQ